MSGRFTIEQDASNGFLLTIDGKEFSVASDEELTDDDIVLFEKIEHILNQCEDVILG